jgi:nicotinamide-nucleotide amidase
MKTEIITCGTELLLGHNIDTNTSYLSKVLSHIGIDVYRHTTVGDNKERLAIAVKDASLRANVVIITGGLGPTVDDITIGTLATLAKRDLVFNKAILKNIKGYFKRRASGLPKSAIKQALIPRGADWLQNRVGTAPGLILEHEDTFLIALPGPPRELIPMVEKEIVPYLKKLQDQKWIIKSRSLNFIGLPEAKVNEKVSDLLELSGDTTLGIYTSVGEVILRITVKAKNEKAADAKIKTIENRIKKRFDDIIYGADSDTLQEAVSRILTKSKKTLAVAESCTGGHLSNLITDISGSSKYFLMGIVAYSNDIKIRQLNISKDLIKKDGAVSKNVAKSMANNVRALAGADIGLGLTGIAGPTGTTKKKPAGLVYIALATKKKTLVKEFRFSGTREEIKLQATQQALNLLRLNI